MSIKGIVLAAALVAAGPLAAASAAHAQDAYPTRQLRAIDPLAAGGPIDVLLRAVGNALQERGHPGWVVDNRVGANTIIGANACKSAPPDGYTVCLLSFSTVSLNPFLYKNLSYDPQKDFEPVINLVFADHVFILSKSVPAKNLKELVDYSKKPGVQLNYASFGLGGDGHLAIEWIKRETGLQAAHVPYAGAPPAMTAFEGGQVQMMSLIPGNKGLIDRIEQGDITGIMVEGDKRIATLPNLPSYAEVGLPPFKARTWFGIFAPKGTPKAVVDRLSRDIDGVVKDPAFQAKYITAIGFQAIGGTPEQFARHIEDTKAAAAELVKLSGVSFEDKEPR